MAYQPSLSDLGDSAPGYVPSMADLPPDNSAQAIPSTQGAPASGATAPAPTPQNSTWQNVLSYAKKILPNPATMPMPLMMNVTAGLMSDFAPPSARNALSQMPQILSGQNYGIPQQIASGFGQAIPAMMSGGPNIATQALSGFALGAAGANPGQALQSGAENALGTTLLGKVMPAFGRQVGSIAAPVTPEILAQNIRGVTDGIHQDAIQGFQNVGNEFYNRGIAPVDLPSSLTDDMVGSVKAKYLPKTATDLINNASTGDYNALRQLRTELWQRATKASASTSPLANNRGDEMFDLTNRIDNAISDHLVNTGNKDLDTTLQDSMGKFRYLKDTFFNKDLPSGFKKLVGPDRNVPNNLGNIVQGNSNSMQTVRNALNQVPENNWLGNTASPFSQNVQSYNLRKGLWPKVKGLGIGGFGASELGGIYKLWNPNSGGVGPSDNSGDNS